MKKNKKISEKYIINKYLRNLNNNKVESETIFKLEIYSF